MAKPTTRAALMLSDAERSMLNDLAGCRMGENPSMPQLFEAKTMGYHPSY